jgi:3-oxoacyl-[acyl-carrier-protein] synthase III
MAARLYNRGIMKNFAKITAIEYFLPESKLTNDQLSSEFLDWSTEKIFAKTGIASRHLANENEFASDLGVNAAKKLFNSGVISPNDIDYLLFCTQSADYFLPSTSCIVQDRLSLPNKCGAIDINQGCSGFIYSLGIAKALFETNQAKNILIITADTYSKYINKKDKSVRTIFGDAAAATLIQGSSEISEAIYGFSYGTDGSGFNNLIVPSGGMRSPKSVISSIETVDVSGNIRSQDDLFMDGAEIFAFTMKMIPNTLDEILSNNNLSINDIDLFVFHQANKFMLDHLRKKLSIPEEKFYINFSDCGNTVSSTIPIALKRALQQDILKPGIKLCVMGFGVGYSWAGAIIEW